VPDIEEPSQSGRAMLRRLLSEMHYADVRPRKSEETQNLYG